MLLLELHFYGSFTPRNRLSGIFGPYFIENEVPVFIRFLDFVSDQSAS